MLKKSLEFFFAPLERERKQAVLQYMRDQNVPAEILLPADLQQQIAREGAEGYPDEICGFLIGRVSFGVKTVNRLQPIPNDWAASGAAFALSESDFASGSMRRRFAISPADFYQADKAARASGEDILGFYHSHPDSSAVPSNYDLRRAQEIFSGYSYVILAVPGGVPAEITAWTLTEDAAAFRAETMRTAEDNETDATFSKGVDRILWEIWDPIGVNDHPGARDEYADYVPVIANLLRRDASDAEFLAFLQTTERQTMGLRGSNREHLMAVIAHLRRFAEGE